MFLTFKTKLIVGVLVNLSFLSTLCSAGNVKIFNSENPLNLEISADFEEVFYGRVENSDNAQRELHDSSIAYNDTDLQVNGNTLAQIKVRGWNRLRSCDFPSLELKIEKKGSTTGTPFSGVKKLKAVTRCNERERARWVNRELALYKLYEIIEPLSLRTRLTNIKLRQRSKEDLLNLGGNIISQQDSFLIESMEMLERRLNLIELNVYKINPKVISKTSLTKMNLFNYMIGNYDVEISNKSLRNVKLMQSPTSLTTIHAIPFDFDYADWVRKLRTRSPIARYGFCSNYEDVVKQIPLFIQNKDKMVNLINNQSYLLENEKKAYISALLKFMDFISKDSNVRMITSPEFRENCKMY